GHIVAGRAAGGAGEDGAMATFRKTDEPTTLRFEAAGLRWLADAVTDGGAPVVEILAEGEGWLDLVHLPAAPATAAAAAAFGCAPPGWAGEVPRSSGPMPLHAHDAPAVHTTWGEFYADYQIRPYAERARAAGAVDDDGARVLERVAARLEAGDFDHAQPALVGEGAARLHGDLWGGNVVWTRGPDGPRGVLID